MLQVTVPATEADVVADALWAAGATAVHEVVGAAGAEVVLTADVDAGAVEELRARWPDSVRVVKADDGWWDGWRPFARAIHAGRLFVRPPWVAAVPPPGTVEVLIDPGRSFGSGSHPTTVLMLEALDSLMRTTATPSVLDVGCGSGVLCIAALRLGASAATAIDNDHQARDATARNAVSNGVEDRLRIVPVASSGDTDGYDVVLANLGSPLVIELAPEIIRCGRPNGTIVLGGLLESRWRHVPSAYPGWVVQEVLAREAWISLVLRAQ